MGARQGHWPLDEEGARREFTAISVQVLGFFTLEIFRACRQICQLKEAYACTWP